MVRVAVIGAGKIGSLNDSFARPEPLSHVGAILSTPGLELSAIVDSSEAARSTALQQWAGQTRARVVASIESLGESEVDVVSICTPTAAHLKHVEAALKLQPRVIIIEKPLAGTLDDARRIASLCEKVGITTRVNFNRRFDEATERFHDSFPGPPKKVIFRYSKGILNYGSHMVDLLIHWFGQVDAVQAVPTSAGDLDQENPAVDFRCRLEKGIDAYFFGFDGLSYDLFDLEIYFADRRMIYVAGGAKKAVECGVDGIYYPGYVHLREDLELSSVGQVTGFKELYTEVERHLVTGAQLRGCRLGQAVEVQRVLQSALSSAAKGGCRIDLH